MSENNSNKLTTKEVLERFPLIKEVANAIAEADRQYALDLINQMKIVHYDTDSGETGDFVYDVTVEDNEENRNIIKQLGYSNEEIDRFESYRENEIDITHFVWKYANYFDGECFLYE